MLFLCLSWKQLGFALQMALPGAVSGGQAGGGSDLPGLGGDQATWSSAHLHLEGKGKRGCASSDKAKSARGGRVTQISCTVQGPQARCVSGQMRRVQCHPKSFFIHED